MYPLNEWVQVTAKSAAIVVSPVKETQSIEIVCEHPNYGEITGNWWLNATINSKGVPNWQATMERLLQLGCDAATLRDSQKWINHIAEVVPGKTLAIVAEENEKGYVHAKAMGIPKGSGSGFQKVEAAASPFNQEAVPMAAPSDEDMPF